MKNYLKYFMVYFVLECVNLQTVPENPCPNFFQYLNTDGRLHGRVEFVNDFSGSYHLAVNMSVAVYLGSQKNIQLHLLTSTTDVVQGSPLMYNIYFPVQHAIPKPTKVLFNEKNYCSASPEKQAGGYVTNMWADTYLKITTAKPLQPETPLVGLDSNVQPSLPLPSLPTPNTEVLFTGSPQHTTEATGTTTVSYSDCGVTSFNARHLVINGDEVQEGQFPWVVAIMYKVGDDYKYRCTGTLISNRHVITAGHCLQYGKAPLFVLEELMVVLGIVNLRSWATSGTISGVQRFVTHPAYSQKSADSDIAIITLSSTVEFKKNIRPACLWNESDDLDIVVELEGTVAGWGSDNSDADYSSDARSVSLPVVSQAACLRSDPGFISITSVRTFCAGRRDNTGPCTGDSGAGFMIYRNGRWLLRGVTSMALKDVTTCDLEHYFVFADVAKVKGWVSAVLV